jgi:hypothetical protein
MDPVGDVADLDCLRHLDKCSNVHALHAICMQWTWRNQSGYALGMCRNIKTLHNFEPSATDEEIRASALQYVRKVSGMQKPSAANAAVFERAVDEIAHVTYHLLSDLVTSAPPRDREVEAEKARARAEKRFGTPVSA